MRRAPGDSDAWRSVGLWFCQDPDILYERLEDGFRSAARTLDARERRGVVAVLDRSLAEMTDSQLQGLWRRSGANILIAKGLRDFLKAGRAILAAPPERPR